MSRSRQWSRTWLAPRSALTLLLSPDAAASHGPSCTCHLICPQAETSPERGRCSPGALGCTVEEPNLTLALLPQAFPAPLEPLTGAFSTWTPTLAWALHPTQALAPLPRPSCTLALSFLQGL